MVWTSYRQRGISDYKAIFLWLICFLFLCSSSPLLFFLSSNVPLYSSALWFLAPLLNCCPAPMFIYFSTPLICCLSAPCLRGLTAFWSYVTLLLCSYALLLLISCPLLLLCSCALLSSPLPARVSATWQEAGGDWKVEQGGEPIPTPRHVIWQRGPCQAGDCAGTCKGGKLLYILCILHYVICAQNTGLDIVCWFWHCAHQPKSNSFFFLSCSQHFMRPKGNPTDRN